MAAPLNKQWQGIYSNQIIISIKIGSVKDRPNTAWKMILAILLKKTMISMLPFYSPKLLFQKLKLQKRQHLESQI